MNEIEKFLGKLVLVEWLDAQQHANCAGNDEPLVKQRNYGLLREIKEYGGIVCVNLVYEETGWEDVKSDYMSIPIVLITNVKIDVLPQSRNAKNSSLNRGTRLKE